MPRYVFYSFHYDDDEFRVQQVKNMGVLESQPLLRGNEWEEVKKGGSQAIESWIDRHLAGRTCLIVLVGAKTAFRPWVQHEIRAAWERKMGVAGIRIHRLLNSQSLPSAPGYNPFEITSVKAGRLGLSDVVQLYDPPGSDSKAVYANISSNIEAITEQAIGIRRSFE